MKDHVDRSPWNKRDLSRFDGNVWREFQFDNGSRLILTTRGQEIFRYHPELRNLVSRYKNEANNPTAPEPGAQVRRFFRPGGNSEVYRLGDSEYLIKEGYRGHRPSLWHSLSRMDFLHSICMRLDPFVKVPEHYALFIPVDAEREYLMMRKINDGVTVKDVLRGRVSASPEVRAQVAEDFEGLKPKIVDAKNSLPPQVKIPYTKLLADWTDENVLVDFTLRPRGRDYTLWIIDQ